MSNWHIKGLDQNQKENFKISDLYYGKLRPQDQKMPEKTNDPLPINSAHPSKS